MKTITIIFQLGFCLIYFSSCFISQFNESGKEVKLKCIYFLPDSLKIKYDCNNKEMIKSITVIDKGKNRADTFHFEIKFNQGVSEYTFPFSRNLLTDKSTTILLGITNSHFREGYSIHLKPEDFLNSKKVFCSTTDL